MRKDKKCTQSQAVIHLELSLLERPRAIMCAPMAVRAARLAE
jgi:hypothetical protein